MFVCVHVLVLMRVNIVCACVSTTASHGVPYTKETRRTRVRGDNLGGGEEQGRGGEGGLEKGL